MTEKQANDDDKIVGRPDGDEAENEQVRQSVRVRDEVRRWHRKQSVSRTRAPSERCSTKRRLSSRSGGSSDLAVEIRITWKLCSCVIFL